MYQDYLDVDIEAEPDSSNANKPLAKGVVQRGTAAVVANGSQRINTDEVEEESEGNDDELIENNNEFQRKKPNSVTGIAGGGGGLMVRKQQVNQQFNNFIQNQSSQQYSQLT